jgi:hypothetical protein
MKNSVKVAVHPETKAVITPSKNNPEYGTIRLEETGLRFSKGFVNGMKRSAFIRGKIKDLASFAEGMELPGTIVAKESLTPWYKDQSPKINPSTKDVILSNGQPVYLQYEYSEDANAQDQLINASATAKLVLG